MTVPSAPTFYLDCNATTRVHPEVIESMRAYQGLGYANPSSQHQFGRRARQVLEDSRDRILALLGADPGQGDRLIFTSGATEANNLAIRGLVDPSASPVVISSIEHPSVMESADWLAKSGQLVVRWGVSDMGRVGHQTWPPVGQPPQLISLMVANHETGVLQPIEETVHRVQQSGWSTRIHTDAVQAVGKHPVDFRELGVDAMTISAHKFQGPAGVGGLIIRAGCAPAPILFGGPQQLGVRPGTEPVAMVVGMRAALEVSLRDLDQCIGRMRAHRDLLERRLLRQFPWAVVHGCEPRLPNTLNISFEGIDRQSLLAALDMNGVACATGSACESGSSQPSAVLIAMGKSDSQVRSAVRFSFGGDMTEGEAEEVADRIVAVVSKLAAGVAS